MPPPLSPCAVLLLKVEEAIVRSRYSSTQAPPPSSAVLLPVKVLPVREAEPSESPVA